jgi:hypothetical protein
MRTGVRSDGLLRDHLPRPQERQMRVFGSHEMSYELGDSAKKLILPNPLKIHNIFVMVSAFVTFMVAISLLLTVRSSLSGHVYQSSFTALVLAISMISVSIWLGYSCLSELKFYFGIGRPRSLAEVLAPNAQGANEDSDYLNKMLRQQALEFEEPMGPLASLLHALIPNLIYAPLYLRRLAEEQFMGALTFLVLLVSMCLIILLGVPAQPRRPDLAAAVDGPVVDDIALAFLIFAVFRLVRPYSIPEAREAPSGLFSVKSLTLLIVLGFLVPVILTILVSGLRLPTIVSPFPHVFILLVAGLTAYALFFGALVGQLLPPPAIAVSPVVDKWNLSFHPAMIVGEFERAMHESWREKIPNRRYCRRDPQIDMKKKVGSFEGEILEETQPFPQSTDMDMFRLLKRRGTCFCILLDLFGAVSMTIASVEAYSVGTSPVYWRMQDFTSFIYVVICFALAKYALDAAHALWLRFDYESRLIRLEITGQFTSAQVEAKTSLQYALRASSTMVQIEAMTFILWVAQLHTVAFGKDAPRQVVSMAGNYGIAEALAERLRRFVVNQASIAAVSNAANAERLAGISAMASGVSPKPTLADPTTSMITLDQSGSPREPEEP